MNDYIDHCVPYLVIGGEMGSHIKNLLEQNENTLETWAIFKKEHGIEHLCVRDRVVGATFYGGVVPEGWVHRQKDPCGVVVPKVHTPLRWEYNDLPWLLGWADFSDMVGCPADCGGQRIYPSFELVGENMVVWVPVGALGVGYVPLGDVQRLDMSKYRDLTKNCTSLN